MDGRAITSGTCIGIKNDFHSVNDISNSTVICFQLIFSIRVTLSVVQVYTISTTPVAKWNKGRAGRLSSAKYDFTLWTIGLFFIY